MAKVGQAPSSPLSYAEAELVALRIMTRWTGLTGQKEHPQIEQITDLVQRILRETAVVIADREG